jgi:hypothetical protein
LTPCLSSILAYIIALFGEKINWQSDGFFTITPLSKMCNFHSFDYDWLRMIITWSWMIMNDREWSWMIVNDSAFSSDFALWRLVPKPILRKILEFMARIW